MHAHILIIMEPKHIKPDDVEESDFRSIRARNLFNDPDYENFSVAVVKIIGEQKFGINSDSDVAYYVLEGEGKFFVEEEVFCVKKGDLVFIPKDTKYKDSSELTFLAVSSPRFEREKRKKAD